MYGGAPCRSRVSHSSSSRWESSIHKPVLPRERARERARPSWSSHPSIHQRTCHCQRLPLTISFVPPSSFKNPPKSQHQSRGSGGSPEPLFSAHYFVSPQWPPVARAVVRQAACRAPQRLPRRTSPSRPPTRLQPPSVAVAGLPRTALAKLSRLPPADLAAAPPRTLPRKPPLRPLPRPNPRPSQMPLLVPRVAGEDLASQTCRPAPPPLRRLQPPALPPRRRLPLLLTAPSRGAAGRAKVSAPTRMSRIRPRTTTKMERTTTTTTTTTSPRWSWTTDSMTTQRPPPPPMRRMTTMTRMRRVIWIWEPRLMIQTHATMTMWFLRTFRLGHRAPICQGCWLPFLGGWAPLTERREPMSMRLPVGIGTGCLLCAQAVQGIGMY